MNITIVDYGAGNIFSVDRALKHLGYKTSIDTHGRYIGSADLVIVPGVAAFGLGMRNLIKSGQLGAVISYLALGQPLIGLCLGAQMLLEGSYEDASESGMSRVEGQVIALDKSMCRVPQQGWSKLEIKTGSTFAEFSDEYMYFSHSFKMEITNPELIIGRTHYGGEGVTALYHKENILGVQFHPERSGEIGLNFLNTAINKANIWT